jgi:hypothetical protein
MAGCNAHKPWWANLLFLLLSWLRVMKIGQLIVERFETAFIFCLFYCV